MAGAVLRRLFDVLQSHADQAAQALGEGDLVLQVERIAFGAFEEVVGVDQRRLGFAIHRVVDVQAIGGCRHALRVLLAVAVVLVFEADQALVLPTANVELAVQLGLGDGVVPLETALAIKTAERIAHQALRLGTVALESALGVMVGQAQLPVFGKVVFQGQVERLVVVVDTPVIGLAEKTRAADRSQLVVHRRYTAVEH
ncbi:hypothetical protein D3C77_71480 [compost metagenome]